MSVDVEKKEDYLKKWEIDDIEREFMIKEFFYKNFQTFFDKIPPTIKEIVSFLLDNYKYISLKKYKIFISEIYKKILDIANKEECNILILPIIDTYRKNSSGEFNSSNIIQTEISYISRMNKENNLFVLSSYDKIKECDENDIIVFIDDFSGTGNTFINLLKNKKNIFDGRKIIIITMVCMKKAKSKLQEYAELNKLNIEFITIQECDKAFELFSNYADNKRKLFTEVCNSINICSDVLGYGNSEALISFYYNTPNNTIKIFWKYEYENEEINLFHRYEKKRYLDVIKNSKKNRKKNNYEQKQYY